MRLRRRNDPVLREREQNSRRQWGTRNAENLREYSRRYYELHYEENRARNQRWRETNPGKAKERSDRYYEAIRSVGRRLKTQWVAEGRGCMVCGEKDRLQIHHIIHRAEGGEDTPSNYLLLCHGHHLLFHGKVVPPAIVKTIVQGRLWGPLESGPQPA